MSRMTKFRVSIKEVSASRDFRLLVGLAIITVIEAISYAWIEVLLYTSINPILDNTWLFGHYTTYHVVLAVLVLAMVFGVGFFGSMVYTPTGFYKFMFFAFGNFLLWLMLEDEFTFVFSGSPHTSTDWTNWPIGAIPILGYFIPAWYVIVIIAVGLLWYFALTKF
ncbi:MAG TPA: hypothetical protein VFF30_07250 [Nitrososphaerales archaeon]|nr:hypothetical protein [Nitrososphaerales archaeon]